ncbi:MAG: hypothetical protein MUF46_07545, partial [Desulfobacterales bacterium]|nr:hypothetical protein [Desulfobacterales bacterium]
MPSIQSPISPGVNAFPSESIGTRWRTFRNPSAGADPTLRARGALGLHQLRETGLDGRVAPPQGVVFGIGDRGLVQLVIEPVVAVDQLPQLGQLGPGLIRRQPLDRGVAESRSHPGHEDLSAPQRPPEQDGSRTAPSIAAPPAQRNLPRRRPDGVSAVRLRSPHFEQAQRIGPEQPL